jgi:hypothetical protein
MVTNLRPRGFTMGAVLGRGPLTCWEDVGHGFSVFVGFFLVLLGFCFLSVFFVFSFFYF